MRVPVAIKAEVLPSGHLGTTVAVRVRHASEQIEVYIRGTKAAARARRFVEVVTRTYARGPEAVRALSAAMTEVNGADVYYGSSVLRFCAALVKDA